MTQRASVFSSAVASIGALAFASTAAAMEPTAQAMEFYNAGLDHYFMTALQFLTGAGGSAALALLMS